MLKLQPSLRVRLILLVLAAMLPLCAWSVYNSVRESRADLESARSNLQTLAALASAWQDQVVESARYLLTAVGQAPGLDTADAAECKAYFQKLRGSFPAFINFGLLGVDGYTRCHSNLNAPARVYAGDRVVFREVMRTGQFVIGGYIVDRLTGRDALVFGMPVKGEGGQLVGVAFASLDLEQMGQSMQALRLPTDARLTVVDPHGLVLVSNGKIPVPLGVPVVDSVLKEAIKTFRPGVAEGQDF